MAVTRSEGFEKRVEWFLANEDAWRGASGDGNVGIESRKRIVKKLQDAGLVAKSTYHLDIDLPKYIREARKRRAAKAAGA